MQHANIDSLIRESFQWYWGDDVDEAPDKPGIYAWFIPHAPTTYETLGKCFASIEDSVKQFTKLTELTGRVGITEVSLKQSTSGENWEARIPPTGAWDLTDTQTEDIANKLLPLSILAPPIYIGKATGKEGLKQRLRAHVTGKIQIDPQDPYLGSFAARVEHLMNNPSQLKKCIVACIPIVELPNNDQLIREIEHFLIRSLRPSLSKRG